MVLPTFKMRAEHDGMVLPTFKMHAEHDGMVLPTFKQTTYWVKMMSFKQTTYLVSRGQKEANNLCSKRRTVDTYTGTIRSHTSMH